MDRKLLLIIGIIGAGIMLYFLMQRDSGKDILTDLDKNDIKQTKERKEEEPANNKPEQKTMGELKIETTKEGSGDREVKNGDSIAVHYTGKLTDGTKFDSSVDRGTPFEFVIGQGMVIQGWEKGLLGMKVGEKRTLTIPSEMGYGSRGAGNAIPPNATLIFETELISIK